MSARSSTLTYALVAVAVVAVMIGAALVYNPFGGSGTSQQGSAGSSTPAGQASQSSTQGSSSSIQSGTGTLNIYLTDAPPSSKTLRYLLVNISSVDLRYEGSIATTTTPTTSSSTTSSSITSSSTSSSTTTTSTSSTTSTTSQNSPTPQNLFVFKIPADKGTNVNLTSLQGQSLLLGAQSLPAGNITSVVLNITGARAFYTDGSSEQLKVVADGKLMIPIQFGVTANGSTDLTFDLTPNLVHISQGGVLTPVIHATAVERGRGGSTTTTSAEVTDTTQTSTTT